MKNIYFLFVLALVLIPSISAAEWDNVKSYDVSSKTITISNAFDFPLIGTEIATAKLDTPHIFQVEVGYRKVMQFTINPYLDYENLLSSLESYDLRNNNEKIEKKIDIKYWGLENYSVEDYKCADEKLSMWIKGNCVLTGTHIEKREAWINWDKNAYASKEIVVGLFTNVGVDETIDVIPTIAGVKISEWAVYTSGNLTYTDGAYTVVVYKNNGTFNTTASLTAAVLVVAGGGGAGKTASGGGGAGGYIYNTSFSIDVGNYSIVVGGGGVAQSTSGANGNNGTNSSFSTLVAYGGGGSASYDKNAYPGGSGGGLSSGAGTPGSGFGTQGFAGGNGDGAGYMAGGGGGASAVGGIPIGTVGGLGGAGESNSINGTNLMYACGGGAGVHSSKTPGTGGCATAGSGGSGSIAGGSATANFGGGGGGSDSGNGGAGGSGIVIIRYLTPLVTCNFSGYVKDSGGTALENSTIIIINQELKTIIYNTTASSTGYWSILIPNGTYNYSASAYYNDSLIGQTKPFIKGTC